VSETLDVLGTFSVSAADAYLRCPRQHRLRREHEDARRAAREAGLPDPGADELVLDVARRRGRVLHAAIAAALTAARIETDNRGMRLGGARLDRYWAPARRALGVAWEAERMPSDHGEADLCLSMLRATLAAVEAPAAGVTHSIEQPRTHCTASGVQIRYVPDWVRWTGRRRLCVTDWKTGRIETDDVNRHQQLHAYAAWLAAELGQAVTSMEIELFAMRDGRAYRIAVDPARAARAADRVERVALRALADTEFAPAPGPHCGACWFRLGCPAVTPSAPSATP
jgi:PD-(D/E)XK nuclease superfamily